MSPISDSLGITVMRALTLMMKFPSESSQSLSSPEAEGRGLAQSQLVSAGLGVSWPRLSRGRARLTRVRTPASDGSRGRSVAIVALSSTVNSQQTVVRSPGDLVLTCYRQTPIVTAVKSVRCVRRHGGNLGCLHDGLSSSSESLWNSDYFGSNSENFWQKSIAGDISRDSFVSRKV